MSLAFALSAPVLSAFLLASETVAPVAPGDASSAPSADEAGATTALFSWGDVDGDGRLDLAAVGGEGQLRLLANLGDGRFEDVTERFGLAAVGNAALALWADYDGDGRLDLFVGARAGASRLFHNAGGVFVDISDGSGLSSDGAVQTAQWLDHDGDGRLDLFVVTADKNELFRGLEGGFFEASELPRGSLVDASGASRGDTSSGGAIARGGPLAPRPIPTAQGAGSVGSVAPSPSFVPTPAGPFAPAPASTFCLPTLEDEATSACLTASSTPALGKLYPISANLFVATGGAVGIGTTSPMAKLDVAGTTRMTDTLTLEPSGDQALNVSTGSIYKSGALFIHTKGASNNLAIGRDALANVTTGFNNVAVGNNALNANTSGATNVAIGYRALLSNTSGNGNTVSGYRALTYNTVGAHNTATGYMALRFNSTGNFNTADGRGALSSNTTGTYNTGCGMEALAANTIGSRNIALGRGAGASLTTGNSNIMIGNGGTAAESATIRIGSPGLNGQTRAFIAGIRGVTTGNANAIPVLIDNTGQLGTVSSSRRFKKDIADMGERSERLLELRPVVFHYKQEQTLPDGSEVPLEYGLIAEEVAEIFPDLVVYDDEGQPFTVKYHLLSSILLNEMKRMAREVADQQDENDALKERVTRLESLEKELATMKAALQGLVDTR